MKLTNAQLWLVHTLETLFFGAIVTGGIGVYQAVNTGNYSLSTLAAIFVPAALAVLSKGWSGTIANNANLGTALLDSVNEVKGLVVRQPVTVHVNSPTPTSAPAPALSASIQPTRPAPQPILLPTPALNSAPDLSQPMQWWGIQNVPPPPLQNPQALPAVLPAAQPTPALQPLPAPTSNLLQFSDLQRHFGDTGIIPSVGSTGQG